MRGSPYSSHFPQSYFAQQALNILFAGYNSFLATSPWNLCQLRKTLST
jgi:hypothetical protein